ncbi:FAD dependent oxidoreductase [Dunaliella salina]|uniref:L-2-hydroxyglutarate dehydrogenase, mitochondrial n=1 Tax=Dunaliella salina TaxID=3046 RepID=A0ABQ7H7R0_DUNSA|nr:FAD dependent oxidoreductase [Dunaliella salina]|eukprot:KAF5842890.1 FAD dependent oxidoreductase [Dunaliella salina]
MFQPTMFAWRALRNAVGPSKGHGARALCTQGNAQHVDCVVMGAGVVGLAIARSLALAGREVVILDSNSSFGSETSSRNSEVIHAGLYYPPGSLKSTMCIEGNRALYDFCGQRAIPYKNTGKLVVASTKEQIPALRALHSRAQQCGARGLQLLSREEAVSLEPNVDCQEALLSPSSGILDSHTYMATLLADAESSGAVMAVASRVLRGKVLDDRSQVFMGADSSPSSAAPADASCQDANLRATSLDTSSSRTTSEETPSGADGHQRRVRADGGGGGIVLEVEDLQSQERMELHASMVVNSAGLHAQSLSHSIDGISSASIPPLYLAKGNYFTLAGGSMSQSAHETCSSGSKTSQAAHEVSSNGSTSQTAHEVSSSGNISQSMHEASSNGCSIQSSAGGHHQGPRPSFSRLIYPMPPASGGGLGIHLTLDMGGGLRFGPDVEHVNNIDYTVDPGRAPAFEQAIRSYWPGLPAGALVPAYAGIRPKVSAPGHPAADFVVQGPKHHGIRGLVCLYGIESPGLTASLVLAEHVKRLLL